MAGVLLLCLAVCVGRALAGYGHSHAADVSARNLTNLTNISSTELYVITTEAPVLEPIVNRLWVLVSIDVGIVLLFLAAVAASWVRARVLRPWIPTQASIALANGRAATWLDATALGAGAGAGAAGRRRVGPPPGASRREIMLATPPRR